MALKKHGIIIRQISNLYTVEADNELYNCSARGKFIYDKITPLVGDRVIINTKDMQIIEILPRRNVLTRPSIANIDAAVIITSTTEPKLDLNLLDRLLVLIIHNNIEPIICLTKLDLLKDQVDVNKIKSYYQDIGIKVLANTELELLQKEIESKTVVLTGQTGAGKTTLLNNLDKSLNLKTSPISKALGRGVHTTRHVELFKYKTSLIADTPGFSSLDITNLTNEEIRNTYPEFNVDCEFKDCSHVKEQNCEVKRLLSEGKILKSRYENYLKFVR